MRIPKKVLAWRETMPKGYFMSEETFQAIEDEARKRGYKDPKAVAGKAYWSSVLKKYKESHPSYKRNLPKEMSWWEKYKALMTGKDEEDNPPIRDIHIDIDSHNNPPIKLIRPDSKIIYNTLKTHKVIPINLLPPFYLRGLEELQEKDIAEVREGNIYLKNPPIPASSLMDLATARTIDREIADDMRLDYPGTSRRLDQASNLIQESIFKLRKTHPGQIDFENPPSKKIKILRSGYTPLTLGSRPGFRVDFKLTAPMDTFIEAIKILEKMYPGKKFVSGGSLRNEIYGFIAFTALLRDKKELKKELENPPSKKVLIYSDCLEIRARKPDGRLYKHTFKKGARIYGLPDGSLHIVSSKGHRLHKKFPKGDK